MGTTRWPRPAVRRRNRRPQRVADTVVEAIGDRTDLLVVGHSLGGFTAPRGRPSQRRRAVSVAGMIPAPRPSPGDIGEIARTATPTGLPRRLAHARAAESASGPGSARRPRMCTAVEVLDGRRSAPTDRRGVAREHPDDKLARVSHETSYKSASDAHAQQEVLRGSEGRSVSSSVQRRASRVGRSCGSSAMRRSIGQVQHVDGRAVAARDVA